MYYFRQVEVCIITGFCRFQLKFRVIVLYSIVEGDTIFKDLLRYPLAREGVYAPGGSDCLAHDR